MVKCSRKYLAEDRIWQEKVSPRHDHDFSIPAILETKELGKMALGPKYNVDYREVMMCSGCHAFDISSDKGYLFYTLTTDEDYDLDKFLTKEQQKLPLIKAVRNKSIYRNLKYLDEVYFPDGYVFKRGA